GCLVRNEGPLAAKDGANDRRRADRVDRPDGRLAGGGFRGPDARAAPDLPGSRRRQTAPPSPDAPFLTAPRYSRREGLDRSARRGAPGAGLRGRDRRLRAALASP